MSWSPPVGDFELYEVFLYKTDESLQDKRRVQSSSQQCSFQGLRAGAPYRVAVLTRSGDQSNQSSIWARTGEVLKQLLPSAGRSLSPLAKLYDLWMVGGENHADPGRAGSPHREVRPGS